MAATSKTAEQRPANGTLAWFDSLHRRDFDNGACLDEIRKAYKAKEMLIGTLRHIVSMRDAIANSTGMTTGDQCFDDWAADLAEAAIAKAK